MDFALLGQNEIEVVIKKQKRGKQVKTTQVKKIYIYKCFEFSRKFVHIDIFRFGLIKQNKVCRLRGLILAYFIKSSFLYTSK